MSCIEQRSVVNKKTIFWSLTFLSLLVAACQIFALRYVNDDCFVSFRYAKNLVNGLGLVYNAGERVEGFTNFLWTIIIALGLRLGFDPVSFSMTLGATFCMLTLALYAYMTWKSQPQPNSGMVLIPLTTIGLSLHRDFCAHATSGMETSMVSFFLSSSFVILMTWRSKRGLFLAGMAATLAMMTRPDAIIFVVAAVLYLLFIQSEKWKNLGIFLLPIILLFMPYWFWRYSYFGYFFPNAFYAKSVSLPYYSQGLAYTFLYFKTYYVFALIPLLGIALLWLRVKKDLRGRNKLNVLKNLRPTVDQPRPLLLAMLFILFQVLFVIRIGGDFMFARFFIVITPPLLFVAERFLTLIYQRKTALILGILFLIGIYFRWDQYSDSSFVGFVADERRYFTVDEPLDQAKAQGEILRKYFHGLPVNIAFWAGQLRMIYYADPPVAIEASGGITDAVIAHQEIGERGRPGHEKRPTLEYLSKRNIQFYVGPTDPPPPGQIPLNIILFGSLRGRILSYDNAIMSRLGQYPEVKFINMPEYLDQYIGQIRSTPKEQLRQDYLYFKSFYFDHNMDTSREQAFIKGLDSANG